MDLSIKKVAIALNNLGMVYKSLGQYGEAKDCLERALAIEEKAYGPEHPEVARDLNNLGLVYDNLQEYDEAKTRFERALTILKNKFGSEHPRVAMVLYNLGMVYNALGQDGEAKIRLECALHIAINAGNPELLWNVLGNMSELSAKMKQPDIAILFGKMAINTLQEQRGRLQDMDTGLQKSFLATIASHYKDLASLLIEQGRLPEGQQVMSMLKEEEFFNYIRRDATADSRATRAALTPFETEQFAAYQQTGGHMAALGREAAAIREVKPYQRSAEQKARLMQLEIEISEAAKAFQLSLEQIRKAFASLSEERRLELAQRQQLEGKDDRGLVRDLGSDVALIHFLVMDDKVHLLLTLPEVLLARQSPISEKELNKKIQILRNALQDPQQDPRPLGLELYQILIAPVAAELQAAHTRTLMVSLDGSLRYLPMAALYDGEHYLAESYALTLFTDAARDNLKQGAGDEWYMAGLGVSQAHPGFPALASVPLELSGLVRESKSDQEGVLQGMIRLDDSFTEPSFREGLEYPVLHIASHFSLQPGNETQSFLLLGDGSHMNLGYIRENKFNFSRVDLLTLSACETAVGGTNGNGREIESFGTLAQKQGARGVLATLWPVADNSTGVFMQTMYTLHQKHNLTKAEALRQAQLSFIRGKGGEDTTEKSTKDGPQRGGMVRFNSSGNQETEKVTTFTPDPDAPYSHPYYWAPFILMGNWL